MHKVPVVRNCPASTRNSNGAEQLLLSARSYTASHMVILKDLPFNLVKWEPPEASLSTLKF